MPTQHLFFIISLSALVTGCAYQDWFRTKEPAPVYESNPVVYQDTPAIEPKPEPIIETPESTVETKPIEDSGIVITPIELKPEPLPEESNRDLLTPDQEKELAELEKSATKNDNNLPATPNSSQNNEAPLPGSNPSEQNKSSETAASAGTETTPAAPIAPNAPASEQTEKTNPAASPEQTAATPMALPMPTPAIVEPPPAPPPPPPPFEPLQNFAPLSPVVGTLVIAANKSSEKGNVESATTTIERAIRIEPRNPTLFYKLALLRLKQSKPKLAEDLAKKSVLLAGSDKQLKRHGWLLIGRARDMQNNSDGAKEARKKAEKF